MTQTDYTYCGLEISRALMQLGYDKEYDKVYQKQGPWPDCPVEIKDYEPNLCLYVPCIELEDAAEFLRNKYDCRIGVEYSEYDDGWYGEVLFNRGFRNPHRFLLTNMDSYYQALKCTVSTAITVIKNPNDKYTFKIQANKI